MKKSLSAISALTLLIAGTALAQTDPKDISAALSISGTAFNPATICTVSINPTTISMEAKIEQLVEQGVKQLPSDIVNISVNGDENCLAMVADGKMGYRFTGAGDSVTGHVLANADTSAAAASGVGVGMFSIYGDPIALNTDLLKSTGADHLGLKLVSLDRAVPATPGNVSSTLTVQIERL
ncbi:type 1 fimbrial protein [Citrobacter sp. ku-bf4]|uniref:fimbrial protein n=1 Tax=Citrobacter TaxID=544 RepID=UPI001980D3E9|nr:MULTISPECIES: type 1 fimbrial protein [Citrobacter]MBN6044522.1 type 1 fimbrial protein [Citrobacter sp. ku-bf4]MBS0825899.1 type 1 fimbrial protein [Citrobacter amalonaticus]